MSKEWRNGLRKCMRGLEWLASPVVEEMPFVVTYSCVMSLETFRIICKQIIHYDPLVPFVDLFGRIALCFFIAWLFALLMKIVHKKWLKVFLYIVAFLLFAVQLFTLKLFAIRISPQLFMLLAETNARESSEFVRSFMLSFGALSVYAVVAFFIALSVMMERKANKMKSYFKRGGRKTVLGIVTSLLVAWGGYNSRYLWQVFSYGTTDEVSRWNHKGICQPCDPFSNTIAGLWGTKISAQEMKASIEATKGMDRNAVIENEHDSLNVILIIGESYIKSHASIYGYGNTTTPFMERECKKGNLIVFDDAISPYSLTSKVVRNMLCCNSISHGEKWYRSPFFPAIFKSSGYDVFLYDNQKDMFAGTFISYALNSFIYNEDIRRLSYTQCNKSGYRYDGELIEAFHREVCMNNSHNFIIFHLMGQHMNARERFPHTKENVKFGKDDVPNKGSWLTDDKRQMIADYDNATLYNDMILGGLFSKYNNTNTVIVYLSDHGEEIYDYRDSKGRTQGVLTPDVLKYQYEIPFVVWCSDKYKLSHPAVMEKLRNASRRPVMSDNLCHLLFYLGGVKTKYYRPERDYISSDYKPCRRIVNDVADYDSIRWGKKSDRVINYNKVGRMTGH